MYNGDPEWHKYPGRTRDNIDLQQWARDASRANNLLEVPGMREAVGEVFGTARGQLSEEFERLLVGIPLI